jgi:hypothetical protein
MTIRPERPRSTSRSRSITILTKSFLAKVMFENFSNLKSYNISNFYLLYYFVLNAFYLNFDFQSITVCVELILCLLSSHN